MADRYLSPVILPMDKTTLRPTAATPKLPSQAFWIVVSEALITISANYSPSPTLAIIHENLPLPTCASPSA